jgi:hypothetical protein
MYNFCLKFNRMGMIILNITHIVLQNIGPLFHNPISILDLEIANPSKRDYLKNIVKPYRGIAICRIICNIYYVQFVPWQQISVECFNSTIGNRNPSNLACFVCRIVGESKSVWMNRLEIFHAPKTE